MGNQSRRGGRGRSGFGGARGRGGWSSRGSYQGGSRWNADVPFVGEIGGGYGLGYNTPRKIGGNAFSLREEARNTERHHDWNSNSSPLRHSTINFISAGKMDPEVLMKPAEQLKPEGSESKSISVDVDVSIRDSDGRSEIGDTSAVSEVEASVALMEDMNIGGSKSTAASAKGLQEPSEDLPFVVDIVTTKTYSEATVVGEMGRIHTDASGGSRPASRASSCSEEILFNPQNRRRKPISFNPDKVSRSITLKSHEMQPTATTTTTTTTIYNHSPHVMVFDDPVSTNPGTEQISLSKSAAKKMRYAEVKDKRAKKAEQSLRQGEEDALLGDYIANMDKEYMHDVAANRRDLGGDTWEDASEDENECEEASDEECDMDGIFDDDILEGFQLEYFDAMDTDNEAKGDVEAILAKRQHPSGLQYLVRWAEIDIDEASWMLADYLDPSAADAIRMFEEREMRTKSMTKQESCDDDLDDESDDDEYITKKKAQEIADWKLARKLAGVDSGEEEDDLNGDDYEDIGMDHDDFIAMNIDHRKGKFPNATRLAQAYEGFDPMERATPAGVAPKKKAKKKAQKKKNLNLSDKELEADLLNSWERDRLKKKARKAERAALRAEGLLGTGKKNAKQKGIDMEGLQEQITNFLLYPGLDCIALPPMDKSMRKSVHVMASVFGLTSKSNGSGKQRFPILSKTQHSSTFEGNRGIIESTFSSIPGRFIQQGKKGTGNAGGGAGAGRKKGGVGGHTHRDGDVVGAVAPEIPMDNKGRLMMEKMGYKTGMALGAAGNKGIMTPIVAIVKTSKAGLG